MAFSTTVEEMQERGYKELGGSTCRSAECEEEITWWETPSGKKIPMDKDTATPHWETCVSADDFKR